MVSYRESLLAFMKSRQENKLNEKKKKNYTNDPIITTVTGD